MVPLIERVYAVIKILVLPPLVAAFYFWHVYAIGKLDSWVLPQWRSSVMAIMLITAIEAVLITVASVLVFVYVWGRVYRRYAVWVALLSVLPVIVLSWPRDFPNYKTVAHMFVHLFPVLCLLVIIPYATYLMYERVEKKLYDKKMLHVWANKE